jgi:hypothetical protein
MPRHMQTTPASVCSRQLSCFEALRQKQDGIFDEARFWKAVIETIGVTELDEPTPGEISLPPP